MPIHFNDRDVVSELEGSQSALIVPCNLCPAVTVAVRENRPFMRVFRHFLRSAPFEEHIEAMQSRLNEKGVSSTVFRSRLPHQWFMCMWTSGQRKKLEQRARQHDAVVVLGCDSATATVRDAVRSHNCVVVEGMEVAGIMNAQLRLQLPADVSFDDCTVVPIAQRGEAGDTPA